MILRTPVPTATPSRSRTRIAVGVGVTLLLLGGGIAFLLIPNINFSDPNNPIGQQVAEADFFTERRARDFKTPAEYPFRKISEFRIGKLTSARVPTHSTGILTDDEAGTLTFDHTRAPFFTPDTPPVDQAQGDFSVCPVRLSEPLTLRPIERLNLFAYAPSDGALEDLLRPNPAIQGGLALRLEQPYAFDLRLRDIEIDYANPLTHRGPLDTRLLKIAYFTADQTHLDIDNFSGDAANYQKPVLRPIWTVEDEGILLLRPTTLDDQVEIIPLRPGTTVINAELCGKTATRTITVNQEKRNYNRNTGGLHRNGPLELMPFRPMTIQNLDTRGISASFDLPLPNELLEAVQTASTPSVLFELELELASLQPKMEIAEGVSLPVRHTVYASADGGVTWTKTTQTVLTPESARLVDGVVPNVVVNRVILRGTFQKPEAADGAAVHPLLRVFTELAVGDPALSIDPIRADVESLPSYGSSLREHTTWNRVLLVPTDPLAHERRFENAAHFQTYGSLRNGNRLRLLEDPYVFVASTSESKSAILAHTQRVIDPQTGLRTFFPTYERFPFPGEVEATIPSVAGSSSYAGGTPAEQGREWIALNDRGLAWVPTRESVASVEEDLNPAVVMQDPQDIDQRIGTFLSFDRSSDGLGGPAVCGPLHTSDPNDIPAFGLDFLFSDPVDDSQNAFRFACERITFRGTGLAAVSTFATQYLTAANPMDGLRSLAGGKLNTYPDDINNNFGPALANTALILPETAVQYQGATIRILSDRVENIDELIDDPADDAAADAADDLVDDPLEEPIEDPNQPGIPADDAEEVVPDALPFEPVVLHRGADRVVITFLTPAPNTVTPELLTFSYGTNAANLDLTAPVLSDGENGFAVVLTDLQGGGFDEDANKGRTQYFFQLRAKDQPTTIRSFTTLNRRQAILYAYSLVFGDTFSPGFEEEIRDEATYRAIRGGGPAYFYKPSEGEPLSLPGVTYAIMNDPLFKEFDIRLFFTARASSVSASVEQLYRVVHDRILVLPPLEPDRLGIYKPEQYGDKEGIAYWTKQVERRDAHRISLSGVKFALFSSEEYRERVAADAGNAALADADLAFQYVLRRGADLQGRRALAEDQRTFLRMRQALAKSPEFTERLASIERQKDRRTAVNELYEAVLGRPADIDGLDYWTDRSDLTVSEIRDGFLKDGEEK